MAKYRQVFTEFWTDSKVLEELTPEDKFFFLYLLTNPSTTQIGIYEITRKKMAFELGYSTESISALMDRFENHHKLIKYNPDTRELAILNWGKYNLIRGGKPVEDCVKKELEEIKDKSLIGFVSAKITNEKIKGLFLEVSNDTYHDTPPIRTTIRGQEEEEEKEREREEEKEREQEEESYDGGLKIDKDFGRVAKEYESRGFGCPGTVKDQLEELVEEYSVEWILEAFKRSAVKNVRTLNYAMGILRNWRANGGIDSEVKANGSSSNVKQDDQYAGIGFTAEQLANM